MEVLITEGLMYQYPGGQMMHFPDFSQKQGEHALILGQSGSGKTSLLHLIGGLLRPASGRILLLGEDWTGMRGSQKDRFRGRHIGFVFQTPHFIPSLSVFENLSMAAHLAGKPVELGWIEHLLGTLGIAGKAGRGVNRLSIGEQQRVAIARALVNKPELVLADEPSSALDDESCERVVGLLESCAAESGSSLLIVTHDNRLKGRYSKELVLEKQIAE